MIGESNMATWYLSLAMAVMMTCLFHHSLSALPFSIAE